jgi:uncharacterized OB-fold protein
VNGNRTHNQQSSNTNSNNQPKEKIKYESIISDIFEGTLLSRVCCKNCGRVIHPSSKTNNETTKK